MTPSRRASVRSTITRSTRQPPRDGRLDPPARRRERPPRRTWSRNHLAPARRAWPSGRGPTGGCAPPRATASPQLLRRAAPTTTRARQVSGFGRRGRRAGRDVARFHVGAVDRDQAGAAEGEHLALPRRRRRRPRPRACARAPARPRARRAPPAATGPLDLRAILPPDRVRRLQGFLGVTPGRLPAAPDVGAPRRRPSGDVARAVGAPGPDPRGAEGRGVSGRGWRKGLPSPPRSARPPGASRELRRQTGVLRAAARHLQHLDAADHQGREPPALGVGRQQRVEPRPPTPAPRGCRVRVRPRRRPPAGRRQHPDGPRADGIREPARTAPRRRRPRSLGSRERVARPRRRPSSGSGGLSTMPTGIRRTTSAAPPTWSRESWVSTIASSRRTPMRRSAATTGAGSPGGPVSTRAAAPSGLRSRIASPCPMSRAVTRRHRGPRRQDGWPRERPPRHGQARRPRAATALQGPAAPGRRAAGARDRREGDQRPHGASEQRGRSSPRQVHRGAGHDDARRAAASSSRRPERPPPPPAPRRPPARAPPRRCPRAPG